MKRLYIATVAILTVLASYSPARSEDIDLFVQPSGNNVGLPNVLILLDNTANWNTPFTNEKAALVSTVNGLATNLDGTAKFRLGLELFTESGGGNTGEDGGYVRAAIRDLNGTYKTAFANLVNSLDKNADKSNGGKAGKTMADAYMYFSGLAPYTGNNKVKTDYTGNTNGGSTQSNAIYAFTNNALPSKAGSPYTSPLVNGSCAGNYIIYISNGAVQDNSSDNTTATTWLSTQAAAQGITGATTTIPISPSGSQSNVADEWARFMKKSTRAITVYTLDVNKVTNGQGPGWTAMLRSMASVTSGKYFDVNSATNSGQEISNALGRIFSEIQAVNSVFASVSLPTSVNTEGTYLNQVYIGMFRPDQDGFPRWAGNLKQYKLGIVSNQLRTLDADDNQAVSAATGFITECARSFWTPSVADAYWTFRPQGGCTISGTNYDNSNFPDGKIVEKGAQAYVLRSSITRPMKTCSSTFATCAATSGLLDFNNTNVSQANLGAATTAERDALISWHKGLDLDDENINAVTATEMRPSSHGDVIHSRPIAINYGTDASPQVVVYYGGNDGVLRAVNGNRTASIGTVTAGKEIWSFVPPEFLTQIKRLRDNSITINYKGTTVTSPAPQPKPYGMDGAITAYNNNSLFVGMRRGGRVLYAFNVTGIVASTPVAPQLLWKKGCPNLANDTGCSAGFDNIGQTWSAANVLKASGYNVSGPGTEKPMLMMGGGYDNCEDTDAASTDPAPCSSTNKGDSIYLLDAANGTKLQEFATDRGVVGDVFVIHDDATGLALWAYAADIGGNIYRISGADANTPIASTAPGSWTITKIAALGCSTASNCHPTRKFMFRPDIVEKNGTYYLLIGSGDREKPLTAWPNAYGVSNYFFMIEDNPTSNTWLSSENGNCGSNVMCLDSLLGILTSDDPDPTALAAKKGWYLGLRAHEQVVTSGITVFGTTTFSTHTPTVAAAGSCQSNLGTARVYNVRFTNAAAKPGATNRDGMIPGGGLPPSPVAGMVTLDNGHTYPFLIGGSEASPLESGLPDAPSTNVQPKSLIYWYIEK